MKDKKAKDFSFTDAVAETGNAQRKASGKIHVGPTNFKPEELIQGPNTQLLVNDKEHIKREAAIKEYNSIVTTLDPLYSDLTPITKVLVRCFHMEVHRTDAGIIMMPSIKVSVPTQSGQGQLMEVDSPFLYQKKAVIVSAPSRYQKDPESSIKQGNLVQLSTTPLRAISKGKGAQVDLPFAFTHYDWQFPIPPQDMTNPHYGYLLVPIHELEVIIPQNEVKTNDND